MLKAHWRVISRLERIADNLLIIGAFFLTYHVRDDVLAYAGSWSPSLPVLGPIEEYVLVLGIALPVYNALLSLLGAYRSMRFSTSLQLLRGAALASSVVFLCEGFFFYLFKLDLSRSFVAIFCIFSGSALFIERGIVLRLLRHFRVKGKNFRNVLIVGIGAQARQIFIEISKTNELGLKVVGFVDPELEKLHLQQGFDKSERVRVIPRASAITDLPARVVANPRTFEAVLKRYAVDEIIFTDIAYSFPIVEELTAIAVEEGMGVTIAADLFSLEMSKSDVTYFGSTPLIHYHPSPGTGDSSSLVVKRCLDVVVSAGLLVGLSPLMLIVAIAIKVDSAGPVFFRQRRVGLNGRTFVLLKFRSMIDGAEKMLPQLRKRNEMNGPVFKLRDDPRITCVGRVIRRYSIDEVPQLINIFCGDMSLVGPRPPLPDEVSLYVRKHRRRLSMRPGLTCTWQVSGRNEIPDFDKWAELDLEYIDNWSLTRDLKLLFKTIPAVLSGSGAR